MPATHAARPGKEKAYAILQRNSETVAVGGTSLNWALLIASRDDRQQLSIEELKALMEALGGPRGMVLSRENAANGVLANAALGGAELQELVPLRLYRHELCPEQKLEVDPEIRLARPEDSIFVAECIQRFADATGMPSPTDASCAAEEAIERGGIRILEVNNEPMAIGQIGITPAAGQIRIGLIYVPEDHRRQGFARRITLSMTAEVHKLHAVPCLFTDAENDGTDALYRSIGYQPTEELVHLEPKK